MKNTIRTWAIVILVIIGSIQVLSWVINNAGRLEATWSKDEARKQRVEKHDDLAKRAYATGRMWGEVNAQGYEGGGVNEYLFEKMSVEEYRKLAGKLLDERAIDNNCWGADDCADLPTTEQLNEWFGVDWGSQSMPANAFRSGFIDAFVEYLD